MANRDIEIRRDGVGSRHMGLMPDFDRMFDMMTDRVFGNRLPALFGDWPEMGMMKRGGAHIQENEQAYLLTAEIPGIPRENIDIKVEGNLLTIKAVQKEESGQRDTEMGYRQQFRQHRSFQQSFSLPSNVDPEMIEAHYDNGLLEVMLPKPAQAQPKRVEVQTGKGSLMGRMNGGEEKKPEEGDPGPAMKH